jgi:hypothetical protein
LALLLGRSGLSLRKSYSNRLFCFEMGQQRLSVLGEQEALFIGELPAGATAVLRGAERASRAVSLGEACRAQDEQLAGLLDDVHGRVH